jgi:signal transduction histidine kinase
MKEWFPRSSLAMVQEKYREAIRTRCAVQWEEATRHPAGLRYGLVTVEPVRDASGKCTQLIGSVHDITARRQLEESILRAMEQTQHRIGQDLHDGLGQGMTAIALLNNVLLEDLRSRKLPEAEQAARLSKLINEAAQTIKQVSRGLQPVAPDPAGLVAGLRQLAAESTFGQGPVCAFHCPEQVKVHDPEAANHLYRIAQEAVQNALRHSQARKISIKLLRKEGAIVLEIRDDGRGISWHRTDAEGVGLRTMRHRTEAMTGSFEVVRPRAGGTLVRCRVPSAEPQPRTPAAQAARKDKKAQKKRKNR